MNTVGEKLAELRKQKGITQEELAGTIGVSAQSISKWENNTTMPDIMLLPVIADIFGITIDGLFRRKSENGGSLPGGDFYGTTCSRLLDTMHQYWWGNDVGISYEEGLKVYKDALKNNDCQTLVIRNDGVVFYKQDIGGIILNRPKNGWLEYLKMDSALPLLAALSDKTFLKLLTVALEITSLFTASSLAKKCGIDEAGAVKHIGTMIQLGIVSSQDLEVDGCTIKVYQMNCSEKIFGIFAVMAYANQFTSQNAWYHGYCGWPNFYLQ